RSVKQPMEPTCVGCTGSAKTPLTILHTAMEAGSSKGTGLHLVFNSRKSVAAERYNSVVATKSKGVAESSDIAGRQFTWLTMHHVERDVGVLVVQVDGDWGLAMMQCQYSKDCFKSARSSQ